jgi:O-antigen/teichoic acid export membrane protein
MDKNDAQSRVGLSSFPSNGDAQWGRRRGVALRWNGFFQYVYLGMAFIQGIMLVPLYVKLIPQAQFGAWLATGNIINWLSLIDPGYSEVIQQRVGFCYGKGDHRGVGEYAGIGLLMSLVLGLAILVLGGSVLPGLGWLSGLAPADLHVLQWSFLLAVVGNACVVASYGYTAISFGMLGSLGPGSFSMLANGLAIIVTVVALELGMGLPSLGLGACVRGVGSLMAVGGYFVWRWRRERLILRINLRIIREISGLAGVFFMGKITNQIATNIESVFALKILGAEIVPIYVLTQRCISFTRSLADRSSIAVMPSLSNLHGAGHEEQLRLWVSRMLYVSTWMMGLLLAGFLALNGAFVRLWVGKAFYAGAGVNALLCAEAVAISFTISFRNMLIALGAIRQVSIFLTIQAVVCSALMWWCGKEFGMAGLAGGSFLGILLTGVWFYPAHAFRLIQFSHAEILAVAREIGIGLSCGLVVAAIFSQVQVGGRVNFIFYALLDALAYVVLLAAFSVCFRDAVWRVLVRGRASFSARFLSK